MALAGSERHLSDTTRNWAGFQKVSMRCKLGRVIEVEIGSGAESWHCTVEVFRTFDFELQTHLPGSIFLQVAPNSSQMFVNITIVIGYEEVDRTRPCSKPFPLTAARAKSKPSVVSYCAQSNPESTQSMMLPDLGFGSVYKPRRPHLLALCCLKGHRTVLRLITDSHHAATCTKQPNSL